MTNEERYKTIKERADAFWKFCAEKPCKECKLYEHKRLTSICKEECAFRWLTLEIAAGQTSPAEATICKQ